ncbi:transposase [Streptomyces sp. NBC_00038]
MHRRANWQVAVSMRTARATAPCPLGWELFLSEEWHQDQRRRRRAG